MRALFFVALLFIAAFPPVAPVAAQEVGNVSATPTPAPSPTPETESCSEFIDARTTLCAAEYDNGTMSIILLSDGDQRLTLTDAGGALEQGLVERRTVVVYDDERTEVEIPVTEASGRVAVTIDTGRKLYAVTATTDTVLLGGPWSASDVQTAGVAGALSASLATLFITWRKVTGRDANAERIA